MTLNRLRDMRNELFDFAAQLAHKLASSSSKPSMKDVIYILERTPCDAEALWLLGSSGAASKERIDGYWASKHDYVKQKLIEKLVNRFHEIQIPVEVTTEHLGFITREDILLTIKGRDGSAKRRIALEIKTGLGINLHQLERLMSENDIVVLVRAETGHIVVLRSCRYVEFLIESMSEKVARIKWLMEGRSFAVPGRNCRMCTNEACNHNRNGRSGRVSILDNDELQSDLDTFLRILPSTISKAVDLVIREI